MMRWTRWSPCLGLVCLLALSACAPSRFYALGFGQEMGMVDGAGNFLDVHLERRPQPRPPVETVETVDAHAIVIVERDPQLRPKTIFQTLTIAGATVVAFADKFHNLALAVVRGELVESITPVFGDHVYAARMVALGDDVAVVFSLHDSIMFVRWSPVTGRNVVAPTTVVSDLPNCVKTPSLDALVLDGPLLWVAFTADAWGRHGDLCHGYSRRDHEVSATVAITSEGGAERPLMHPRRDRPASLTVDANATITGTQDPDIGFVIVKKYHPSVAPPRTRTSASSWSASIAPGPTDGPSADRGSACHGSRRRVASHACVPLPGKSP